MLTNNCMKSTFFSPFLYNFSLALTPVCHFFPSLTVLYFIFNDISSTSSSHFSLSISYPSLQRFSSLSPFLPMAIHLSFPIFPPLVFFLISVLLLDLIFLLCCFVHQKSGSWFNCLYIFYPWATYFIYQKCTSFPCQRGLLSGHQLDASLPQMQTWERTQTWAIWSQMEGSSSKSLQIWRHRKLLSPSRR